MPRHAPSNSQTLESKYRALVIEDGLRNAADAMVLPARDGTAVVPVARPTADRPLPPEPFVTLLRREPQQIAVDRMSE